MIELLGTKFFPLLSSKTHSFSQVSSMSLGSVHVAYMCVVILVWVGGGSLRVSGEEGGGCLLMAYELFVAGCSAVDVIHA